MGEERELQERTHFFSIAIQFFNCILFVLAVAFLFAWRVSFKWIDMAVLSLMGARYVWFGLVHDLFHLLPSQMCSHSSIHLFVHSFVYLCSNEFINFVKAKEEKMRTQTKHISNCSVCERAVPKCIILAHFTI